ncbi:MAG: hypothetical protein ABSB40_06525 [Nitrososphaeria archaeon]
MPKWKKDETKFTVSVNYEEKRGAQSSIPKPIVDALGKPTRITFLLRGKKVEVKASDSSEVVQAQKAHIA